MFNFLHNVWQILLELAPWLLIGIIFAGVLHVTLPPGFIRRHLGHRGGRSILKTVALGVPIPLCSCSVIPTSVELKKAGAADGAAVGFLISTPQTGIDSILVSASFLGWPFALFKVVSAFITGILGGWLVDATDPSTTDNSGDASMTPDVHNPTGLSERMREMLRYGIDDLLYMIWPWLLAGIAVSALITTVVPHRFFDGTMATGTGTALVLALLVSLPLYVCATGSVPIAAALVQSGFPPGAALVFLMAGPATNVATIGAVYRAFGARVLLIYLSVIGVGSLSLGFLFDFVIAAEIVSTPPAHGHSWYAVASAVLLCAIIIRFAVRDLRRKLASRGRRRHAGSAAMSVSMRIEGMTCQGCASAVRESLESVKGVASADVDLMAGEVTIHGTGISLERAAAAVRHAGYTPVV